jgi:hypothetical protein
MGATLKIWRDAENQRQWFASISVACERFDGGAFPEDLTQHWYEVDGELDGRRLDSQSDDDRLRLDRALETEMDVFEGWGLVSLNLTTPREGAFTPNLRLRRPDAPKYTLTKKGRRLAGRPAVWQRFVFLRMLVWLVTQKPRSVLLTAIKIFSPTFAVLNIFLRWETEKAMIGGAVAAGVAAVAAILPRDH